ncbi:DNA adenine methylase [Pseudolysinimonas sp.]|uniref:DNA adenine methylase n=1 Tax=Pseudolysinimonas sp. TaxID=2680009 RepID=UPI003F80CE62
MAEVSAASAGGGSWTEMVADAAPLFKWAGGKQRFLWDHSDRLPQFSGRYIEPFAGGLSVLFYLARRSPSPMISTVSDSNLRLIRCYQDVKRDWRRVADGLSQLSASYAAASDRSQFYYTLRDEYNRLGPSAGAARFIFLMSAGWNGVYRVNQKGQFNVPHGVIRESVYLPSDSTLASVAEVFKFAELRASSWESTIASARPGDFVFLDPPYYSDSRTQLYDRKSVGFGSRDHIRLADALMELARRNVSFLLTNSNHPFVRKLYLDRGLKVDAISMHRSINSRIAGRGTEDELLVTPGDSRGRRRAEAELALRMRVAEHASRKEFEIG